MEDIKSNGGFVISDNTHGNKVHKGGGSPDGGQFTSTDNAGVGGAAAYNNAIKRKHLTNPVAEKITRYMESQKGVKNPNFASELQALADEYIETAIPMVAQETKMSEEEAKEFTNTLADYAGYDYEEFSAGNRPEEVAILDKGLEKMAKYDGRIVRGITFDPKDAEDVARFKELMSGLQEGAEIRVGAKNKSNSKSVSSWTSNDKVGLKHFAKLDTTGLHSVIFVCDNNKSGASIRHISPFGSAEDEVLVPSTSRYRVTKARMQKKMMPGTNIPLGTRTVLIYVEEI